MKFLKKASLAAAIAAAPFAVNAMEALDDATMSTTTGQAGVTIEIDIQGSGVQIGEIAYTDEGTLAIEKLAISNADITQTIDVDASGNLVLGVSAIDDLTVTIGETAAMTDASVASASAVMLRSSADASKNAELVNNLNVQLDMGASTTTIYNMSAYDTATDPNALAATFSNGSITSNSLNSGIVIAAGASIRIDDLDVGIFGYTDEQAAVRADLASLGGDGSGSIDTPTEEATYNALRSGSAIQVNDVTFDDGAGGYATVNQKIWAQGGTAASGGGVYINMGSMSGTLTVGSVVIGGASIGSLAVKDINLSGMTQRIYGH
ncbi:DUF6160 family protein [Thalassolituus sp. LLYu03]|uniref:DUF6160 family protein n=1 Tax=Thalassolituus sp. LLYu03 TaxID=3421656 RepID=UPI003D2A9680